MESVLWHTSFHRCGSFLWEWDIKVAWYWSWEQSIWSHCTLLFVAQQAAFLWNRWSWHQNWWLCVHVRVHKYNPLFVCAFVSGDLWAEVCWSVLCMTFVQVCMHCLCEVFIVEAGWGGGVGGCLLQQQLTGPVILTGHRQFPWGHACWQPLAKKKNSCWWASSTKSPHSFLFISPSLFRNVFPFSPTIPIVYFNFFVVCRCVSTWQFES